jgi:hypothetical protein
VDTFVFDGPFAHLIEQLGGCDWGGYVNDAGQNNPTYEFYPSTGGPVGLNILTTTLPANLFPLTWLLPSGESVAKCRLGMRANRLATGNIFIQANLGTEIFDYKNNIEVGAYPMSFGFRLNPRFCTVPPR